MIQELNFNYWTRRSQGTQTHSVDPEHHVPRKTSSKLSKWLQQAQTNYNSKSEFDERQSIGSEASSPGTVRECERTHKTPSSIYSHDGYQDCRKTFHFGGGTCWIVKTKEVHYLNEMNFKLHFLKVLKSATFN